MLFLCRGFVFVYNACNPPFGESPNCHPADTTITLSSSEACGAAFQAQYNITAPEIVQQLTDVNVQLEAICNTFTTQVRLWSPAGLTLLHACSFFPVRERLGMQHYNLCVPCACSTSMSSCDPQRAW